ncbi:MAG: FAD-linked oxidase C-terminal domain-containing protein [Cellvibrionaceae bacterium]
MSDITQTALAETLKTFIDPEYVIDDAETQKVYECDGLSAYCEMPMLVVLPETVEQVQKAMMLFHQHNIPVVARGAGTSLSAGATPHKEGVVLSLAKFKNTIDIDPLARTARVQPGVRNLAISEAAADYSLYYAPDPSSQIACTIGGNVAENAGGVHCLKYGLTVHNVIKVEMITVEGERVVLGNEGLDSYGVDLLALMNGSEGMLGVITEITVKLLPMPEKAQVILAGFDSVQVAGDSVGEIIARGIIPGGLEMMDSYAIQASEDFANAGYPVDAKALLLCEVDGTVEEVEEYVKNVSALFKNLGATSVRVSKDEAERALLWKGRKSAFPAVGRLSPDYYCMDGTIPRGKLAEVLLKIEELSQHYQLRVANVFHAGDGNLHPLILFDANNPGEFDKTEEFGGKILEACVEAGGCITGEHGVGLEKIRQMAVQFNDQEIAQFHEIKAAFDPEATLNPGKGIPTLRRCQEYRGLPDKEGYVVSACHHDHDDHSGCGHQHGHQHVHDKKEDDAA